MFYTYSQNNSGGMFKFDDNVDCHVIIEAVNAEDANRRALQLGIYFNGCSTGRDCSCCGDRWYKCNETDGTSEPMVYGRLAMDNTDNTRIYYKE